MIDMGNTHIIMTEHLIEKVRSDLSMTGETKLVCDHGLRYIVIEKNIMPEFGEDTYFAFRHVYNKDNVYIYILQNEHDVFLFYERCLNVGFDSFLEYTHYPNFLRWVIDGNTQPSVKHQIIHKDRICKRQVFLGKSCA